MVRAAGAAAACTMLVLAGCADQMVELPIDREPAELVQLKGGPLRCPANTVTYGDNDSRSGAGAVPADFDGRTVLRCEVDYMSVRRRNGVERFTVNQWRTRLTPEFGNALNLPDRGFRRGGGCAASTGSITAVYLVNGNRQSIRMLLPSEGPCHQIRSEVSSLLQADNPPLDATFYASRTA